MSIQAQDKPYAKEWKAVENFESKNQFKSAQKLTEEIYKRAVSDKNTGEQIKAAMHMMHYVNQVQEDMEAKNVFYLDSLIKGSSSPAKNILQSLQAQVLQEFADNNAYQFSQRTQVAKEKSNDILTWSNEKIHRTISNYFLASLEPKDLLQKTSLKEYKSIIKPGENLGYEPTLYEFLAWDAQKYFDSEEPWLTQAKDHFSIDDKKYFSDIATFISLPLNIKDSLSQVHQNLKIYQELLRFHLKDSNEAALISTNLRRLKFVHEQYQGKNADKLFEEALNNFEKQYPHSQAIAEALLVHAALVLENEKPYEALKIYQKILHEHPSSPFIPNARKAIFDLQSPELNTTGETTVIPNEPFKQLVSYKNIPTLYLRMYQGNISPNTRKEYYDKEGLQSLLKTLKLVRDWKQILPPTTDLKEHKVEIKN